MMTMTMLVGAGLFCMLLMYFVVRGNVASSRSVQELEGQTISIDLEAFRNLIDAKDQEFLRQRLPNSNYRKAQRKRIVTCIRYVRACAQNAAILVRLGEAASANANPEISATGQHITAEALRLRIYALLAIPKLYFWLLFPDSELSLAAFCKKYNEIAAAAQALGQVQDFAFAQSNVSAQ